MKPPDDLADQLNLIEWRKPTEVTPAAESLIYDFLEKMRRVIGSLVSNRNIQPGEAFDIARTAGPNSPTHQQLVDTLFGRVVFRSAGVRETLIFPIVSYYAWDEDEQLARFDNPWSPVMELYRLGYTTDFDESPDWKEVSLIVGYDATDKSYRIAWIIVMRYFKFRWEESPDPEQEGRGASWWYYEFGPDGSTTRQIMLYDRGDRLRYGPGHFRDDYAEPFWDARLEELDQSQGQEISQAEFEAIWQAGPGTNDSQ
jgi:hypothetical protein